MLYLFKKPVTSRPAPRLLCAMLAVFLLTACQPQNSNTPSDAHFTLTRDAVTLDKSHIIGVQTSLYQPSFELLGVVLPKEQANIIAPTSGTLMRVFAKENISVKKGDTLALLRPIQDADNTKKTLTIKAPFHGKIKKIHTKENAYITLNAVLLSLESDDAFSFVGSLPTVFSDQLRIGQSVNFSIKKSRQDSENSSTPEPNNPKDAKPLSLTQSAAQTVPTKAASTLTGQIADIKPHPTTPNHSLVTVHMLPESNHALSGGVSLGGRVNYGDLSVGTLVPRHAIKDAADLELLKKPPYTPAFPLPAKVWVIGQDARLALKEVEVVAYKPANDRYLVSGVSQDSLIATAELPFSADGYAVRVR
ncbi:MAG: biotin/lipoyl-containing protein [Moraxella sp.]|nr:biotin/lipoyl-containing protein [Moraxella sp.]